MTSWPSCTPSPDSTPGTCAGTPQCPPCQLARDCSPPLAALSLSGWPEQAGTGSLPGTLLPATADKCGLFLPLTRPS